MSQRVLAKRDDLREGDIILGSQSLSGGIRRWVMWAKVNIVEALGEIVLTGPDSVYIGKLDNMYPKGVVFDVMRGGDEKTVPPAPDPSHYPHKCPFCGGPSYNGLSVDCQRGCG